MPPEDAVTAELSSSREEQGPEKNAASMGRAARAATAQGVFLAPHQRQVQRTARETEAVAARTPLRGEAAAASKQRVLLRRQRTTAPAEQAERAKETQGVSLAIRPRWPRPQAGRAATAMQQTRLP